MFMFLDILQWFGLDTGMIYSLQKTLCVVNCHVCINLKLPMDTVNLFFWGWILAHNTCINKTPILIIAKHISVQLLQRIKHLTPIPCWSHATGNTWLSWHHPLCGSWGLNAPSQTRPYPEKITKKSEDNHKVKDSQCIHISVNQIQSD